MTDCIDEGRQRIISNDLEYDSFIKNIFSIVEGDPISAQVRCERKIEIRRGDWETRIQTYSLMTSDADYFHLTNVLDAYEKNTRIFTRSWTKKIPRLWV
jgi:hypothetical protein